jgi:hypothetical protein
MKGLILIVLLSALVGCHSKPSEPTLDETMDYMSRSIKQNYGESTPLPPGSDVKRVENMKLDHCKLYREVTNYEAIEYDLSDIDPNTIKLEQIGAAWWVVFKTRNFNRSIKSIALNDHSINFMSETGGFGLRNKETAEHYSKAFAHAVKLCGGSPSTF